MNESIREKFGKFQRKLAVGRGLENYDRDDVEVGREGLGNSIGLEKRQRLIRVALYAIAKLHFSFCYCCVNDVVQSCAAAGDG
jgi:hypothetical protein